MGRGAECPLRFRISYDTGLNGRINHIRETVLRHCGIVFQLHPIIHEVLIAELLN